jgi:hypothetical protein
MCLDQFTIVVPKKLCEGQKLLSMEP